MVRRSAFLLAFVALLLGSTCTALFKASAIGTDERDCAGRRLGQLECIAAALLRRATVSFYEGGHMAYKVASSAKKFTDYIRRFISRP